MERRRSHIVRRADRIYLARACELAARGIGNVSPNPPVGAVLVGADQRIIGEGFHHCRGEAHAEVEALRDATLRGHAGVIAGATMYVSLEPCNHHGRTPPCSEALVAARIARVVVAALDPNPRTAMGGVARLSEAGITVDIIEDAWADELIRRFSFSVRSQRPYVTLKLAASLDGRIGPEPGSFWLTGADARRFVHDLRSEHDAVMVGAHTVAMDDPQLTIRPLRTRRRPFTRVVICGEVPPASDARIFENTPMTTTLLFIPDAFAAAYAQLVYDAEVVVVGNADARNVDLAQVLNELYQREIAAILCEGGPTLAAALLGAKLVNRLEWLIAPRILAHERAPFALSGNLAAYIPPFRFNEITRLGEDLRLTVDLERPHSPAHE